MKNLTFILLIFLNFSLLHSQEKEMDQRKIQEDLNEILANLSSHYIYLEEKNVDLNCIKEYYQKLIPSIKTEEQTVLFFENLLNEFYDSHLILNTNRNSSYRLFSPLYTIIEDGKAIISNVWQTQLENLDQNVIGAEILKINGIDFNEEIEGFPTHCNEKASQEVREWIANKILAGTYNQARLLTLRLGDNQIIELDLDKLNFKPNNDLLTISRLDNIGIIRINNSLGDNNLINEFDKTLDSLMGTKGLIIDLRNTVDGGNSYVARGIMGRFISETKAYQKHLTKEQYDGNPEIVRSWIEYVSPREIQYKNPVVILVGRWTGSMGEGLAIGFEGLERGTVLGTEMERLAGEMSGFSFKNQTFGYRLSTAKLFHINGMPREDYVPTVYVKQSKIDWDETLEKGIELINETLEKAQK